MWQTFYFSDWWGQILIRVGWAQSPTGPVNNQPPWDAFQPRRPSWQLRNPLTLRSIFFFFWQLNSSISLTIYSPTTQCWFYSFNSTGNYCHFLYKYNYKTILSNYTLRNAVVLQVFVLCGTVQLMQLNCGNITVCYVSWSVETVIWNVLFTGLIVSFILRYLLH